LKNTVLTGNSKVTSYIGYSDHTSSFSIEATITVLRLSGNGVRHINEVKGEFNPKNVIA